MNIVQVKRKNSNDLNIVYELDKSSTQISVPHFNRKNFSCQFDTNKDMCTSQHVIKRKEELRCYSGLPHQIYVFDGNNTDVSVGRVKAVRREKITRVYLPNIDDQALDGLEILSDICTKEQHKRKLPEYTQTSSKFVGLGIETIGTQLDTENFGEMFRIILKSKEKTNLEPNLAQKYNNHNSKEVSERTKVNKCNVAEDKEDCGDIEGTKPFGKKVNFDEKLATTIPSHEKSKKIKQTNNTSDKKERKRFFFFKKNYKESDKGQGCDSSPNPNVGETITTNRCEIKNELIINPDQTVTPKKEHKIEAVDMTPKISLQRYIPHRIESDKSMNIIIWKNNTYETSSSTVLHTVHKNVGAILRSRSVTSTEMSSFYKSSYGKHLNFQHGIEAWMISKTNPDISKNLPININSVKNINNNNMAIIIPDYKCIDKLGAFAHKIQVVLPSNKRNKKYSSKYLRIDIPKDYFDSSTTEGDKHNQSSEEVFNIIEYQTNSEIQKARKVHPVKQDCHSHNVKSTASVYNSSNKMPKNLDIVVKRPTHRDVGSQGSTMNIPQGCDVIGVGGITQQQDVRDIVNPILKTNPTDFSDVDEEPMEMNQKICEFAESYLRDCYRNWTTLELDDPGSSYSWSVSDTHLPSGSQKSFISLNHNGSRLYIFDDSQIVQMSCNNSDSSPCYQKENRGVFSRKLFGKRKPRIKPISENETWIVLPKDSFEVCKKRKLYAQSNKSQWQYVYDQPVSSCGSIEGKEAQLAEQSKQVHDKSIMKATRGRKCKNKKRVSMPHCEDLEDMLSKQLSDKPTDGILTFKGVPSCVDCAKKGANCPKHAVVDPTPTCIIPPPPCQVTCETKKKPPCNVPNAPSCNIQTDSVDSSQFPLTPAPCIQCSVPPIICPSSLPCNKKMKKKNNKNNSLCSPPGCPIIPCDMQTSFTPPSPCPPSPPSSSQKKPFTCSDLPPNVPCKIPPCETPPCKPLPCKSACQTSSCEKLSTQTSSTASTSMSSGKNSTGQQLSPCDSPPRTKPFPSCDHSTSCPSETTPPATSLPPSSRAKPPSPRSNSPPVCEKPRPVCMKTPPPSSKPLSSSFRSPPTCTVPLPQSLQPPSGVRMPSNKKARPCFLSCDECKPKADRRSPPKTHQPSATHTSPQSPTCLSPQISLDIRPQSSGKNQFKSPASSSDISAGEGLTEPPTTALKPTLPKYCNIPPCSEQKKVSKNAKPVSDYPCSTEKQLPKPSLPTDLLPMSSSKTKNEKCDRKCTMKPKSASEHNLPSNRANEANKSKISGLFLRMKPSSKKTCAAECLSWRNAKDVNFIRLDSDERITIKLNGSTNTEKIKEGMNIKVQDVDGQTLFERKDYAVCGNNKPILNDLYKDSYNRPLAVTNVTDSQSENESVDDSSEKGMYNLIEIQFKLCNGHGNKTELIIENEKHNNDDTTDGIDQKSPSLFAIENNSIRRQENKELNSNNDFNIHIIIKNRNDKHEIAEKKQSENFTKSMCNKLHTVSTGHSGIITALDDGHAVSIHRTTINLSSSVAKISGDLSTKSYTDIEIIHKFSSHGIAQVPSKEKEVIQKAKIDNLKMDNQSEKIQETRPALTNFRDTDEQGATLERTSNDLNIDSDKSILKDEKMALLSKLIEKAYKSPEKTTLRQLKSMLKILSHSSDKNDMNSGSELAKDVTYCSLKPNYFRDTESMNNYYQIESKQTSKGGDLREAATIINNNNEANLSESYTNHVEFESCVCSKLAAKSVEYTKNVRCCRGKSKRRDEMNRLGNDEEMYVCNYNTEDVEHTPGFSKKALSFNVLLSKEVSKGNIFNDSLEWQETKTAKPTNSVTKISSIYSRKHDNVKTNQNAETKTKKDKSKYENERQDAIHGADILQSYETKKAVLAIYEERAKHYTHFVAMLPKFMCVRECEITENCDQIACNSYITVFNENILMTYLK